MMTACSMWWCDQLAEDIHWNLRQKEALLPPFYAHSPQIASRRFLVDWLSVISDSFELCPTARHLAVTLMDSFMDRYNIEEKQLQLVALGCLLVAAKFEEQEVNIPKSSQLNHYATSHGSKGYLPLEYLHIEFTILDFFKWNVALPTPAHFTDYFLMAALSKDDMRKEEYIPQNTKSYIEKYTNYFLEVSMQDHFYRGLKPSQVGAACVAASRACLHISPVWSDHLQELTGYTLQDLNPAVNNLLKTYQVDEESNTRNTQLLSTPPPSSGAVAGTPVLPVITSATPMTPGTPCDLDTTEVVYIGPAMPLMDSKSEVTLVEQTWVPCYNIYSCPTASYLTTSSRIS